VKIEGVEYVYLEDLRKSIGKMEALATLLGIRFFPGKLLADLPPIDPNDTAVVLFTSGSEKAPKAVPLTHRNILTDVQAGASAMAFKRGDILLGFLPPFHSFGLSGNIVLPLAGGVRVVHHADPTDAAGLVRKIAAYKPTLLLTTPTFFSYILGKTGRPRLAPHRRHRRGEMSRRPLRPREGNHAACGPLRRLRHHRMFPRRLGRPP
jgi:long-chain-fatty-acid--[acyl-carrier-protein] ligase